MELNKTIWEVSKRYDNLTPVGSGAYGQVRPVSFSTVYSLCLKINITGIRNVDPEPYYFLHGSGSISKVCLDPDSDP